VDTATVLTLCAGHHALNLWGLSFARFAALALGGTLVLAALLYLGWTRAASGLKTISTGRWVLFVSGALLLAGIGAARFYTSPVSWHHLEIKSEGAVTLLEIKGEGAEIAPFNQMKAASGWKLIDFSAGANSDRLTAWQAQTGAEPLAYAFQGPAGKPVTLLFATSPDSGSVTIQLDGVETQWVLSGEPGQREVSLSGRYRDLPNSFFLTVIVLIDVLAYGFVILLFLAAQELGTRRLGRISGALCEDPENRDNFPYRPMGVLTALATGLHLLNALAVPLVLDVDSPTYLAGAVQWLAQGNLNGVAAQRGPGTTFLFAPVLALFGRNPWGMKLLLHGIGIGCVPLAYGLGWLVTAGLKPKARRWLAVLAGLAGALTPDLYFYSNYVMSDLANVFFGLLFLCLLLKALERGMLAWQAAVLLTASFATLLRGENSATLMVAAAFLVLKALADALPKWKADHRAGLNLALRGLGRTALSCLLAALPLLGWSAHNLQANGFFGLSNYTGAVIYDGWVFFGEASHVPVTDFDSPGIQAVQAALVHQNGGEPVPFTGDTWDDFAALTANGYSSEQAYALMQQAALDSIRKDPAQTLKLLAVKIDEGMQPGTTATHSFPLPGETKGMEKIKAQYFDTETLQIVPLIRVQRAVYAGLDWFFGHVYPAWVWICLAAMALSAFRKPFFIWAPVAVITFLKVIFPLVLGFGMWRYVVAGIVPLEILSFAVIQVILSNVPKLRCL
jgi:hypothetical protein